MIRIKKYIRIQIELGIIISIYDWDCILGVYLYGGLDEYEILRLNIRNKNCYGD